MALFPLSSRRLNIDPRDPDSTFLRGRRRYDLYGNGDGSRIDAPVATIWNSCGDYERSVVEVED